MPLALLSPLGGDCRSVVDQLVDVQDMSGSNSAFAVIKNDGTVLAWGDCAVGGDSRTLAYVTSQNIFNFDIFF